MGKDVEVTTSEEIVVKVYCTECESELNITKIWFNFGVLEVEVDPCSNCCK